MEIKPGDYVVVDSEKLSVLSVFHSKVRVSLALPTGEVCIWTVEQSELKPVKGETP